ncbi:MAG TPA: hypothetical protein VFI99_09820 [Nocardioides sp.]|nr:hypothetical protein [Nocardioides sp.]
MLKIVVALLTALFITLVGGVTVPAGAHDCSCQVDNSGPGSANSGPGNACHDNSGPGSSNSGSSGSSGSDNSGSNSGPSANSGPGNGDECPPAAPGEDPGNDSGDSGNGSNDMGDQATSSSTVVQGAQASVRSSAPTQGASAQVPTAVSAGLTDSPEAPSALPVVMMLIGLTMMVGALVRRRPRG